MIVKKFYADTPREALRLVRAQLGENALILSNRRMGSGVEIMAVAPGEIQAVTAAVAPSRGFRPAGRYPPAGGSPPAVSAAPQGRPATLRAAVDQPPRAGTSPAAAANAGTPAGPTDQARAAGSSFDLVHEVRVLRSLVEGQLAAIAWGELKRRDPTQLEVARRLLRAGLGMKLSRQLADELPAGLDLARATRLTKARLQQLLPVVPQSEGLVQRGGVFALVGPTGVGKTTTVAKVAAECTLRFGAEQVALVTTDTYRIGAVDQLRIYGRILNVPVFAIRDEIDLRMTLADLRSRRLVLIDTVGMSQRDQRLAEQIALLSGAGRGVRRVLLLPAVAQVSVLDDVVQAYRGEDLAGCVLTKVDEAPNLGGALDVLVRHRLALHYVANGQRVPEDLHRPNPLYLVERAFRAASDNGPPAPDAELLTAAAHA
jgi:flagellar biosynthesis protein FlhF